MKCLPLQDSVVYGPLYSRRLGLSLGVNILPFDRKVCSFDCAYCHFGPTHVHTLNPEGCRYPPVTQILREVEAALAAHPDINAITFSGNGEPTLRPQFPALVRAVRDLRDARLPDAKLALFSNASTLARKQVFEVLPLIDLPMLKLDAGDAATFNALNRPVPGLTLDHIVTALQTLPSVTLQSMLVDGSISNARGEAYQAWVAALVSIQPNLVQIYSTDYPVGEAGLNRVPYFRLQQIASDLWRMGLNVCAYGI